MADLDTSKIEQASQIWKETEGQISIRKLAKKVGVSASTVTRWKNNGWKYSTKHGFGTKGNKNAAGHGPGKGNTNGIKTGAYAAIPLTSLSAEEHNILINYDKDPVIILDFEIGLMLIRQKRMLELLEQVKNERDLLTEDISHIMITKGATMNSPTLREHTKRRQCVVDKIIAIEEALTRVQDKTTHMVATRNKLYNESKEKQKVTNQPVTFVFNR